VDMCFNSHTRHLGLRPSERPAERRKSVSSGGAAIWCHVVSHIGAGGYSEMGNPRVDASEKVAERDGAKRYESAFIVVCQS